jgi:hypothetical protein
MEEESPDARLDESSSSFVELVEIDAKPLDESSSSFVEEHEIDVKQSAEADRVSLAAFSMSQSRSVLK